MVYQKNGGRFHDLIDLQTIALQGLVVTVKHRRDAVQGHLKPAVCYGLVALCSVGITVAATIYPALSASRLRPVDGIRYE